jgi:HAD superfamily hydrolase (TIGR01549 family)
VTVQGFLFDLDQTLVDSSQLLAHRRIGAWGYVMSSLHQVRPFAGSPAPHELPGLLRAAGYKIGIVTSSVRQYAEAVLKNFGVHCDVLVAYHDTPNHKPNPEPLQKAIAALGLPPAGVCHVGDDAKDHEASYQAQVTSIGAGWSGNALDWSSSCPDLLAMNAVILLDPAFVAQGSYLTEALAGGDQPMPHDGWTFPCDASTEALGRYFTTSDPRHAHHALSSAILTFKDDDAPAAMFGRAVGEYVQRSSWRPQYIVAVPPKPNQTRNRFTALLTQAQPWLQGIAIYADGLICTKQIDGYKGMGAAAREAAVRGAFQSRFTWNSGRVLLLDDVHTSSATTTECARVLTAAGAGEVRTLVLAKDQQRFAPPRMCDRCGSSMRVQKGRHGPFWSCTNWRKGDPTSCTFSANLDA